VLQCWQRFATIGHVMTDSDINHLIEQKSFDYPLSKNQVTTLLDISDRTLSRYCNALGLSTKAVNKYEFAKLASYANSMKSGSTKDQSLRNVASGQDTSTLVADLLLTRFEHEIESLLPRFPELINQAIDRIVTRQLAQITQTYSAYNPQLPGVTVK
jgi:AraC-like DNA-binding protein